MMHEHNRFAPNGHAMELGQAPFHGETDEPTSLLGEADGVNWENAWIDLGGEG
jgi:hypothetical protein